MKSYSNFVAAGLPTIWNFLSRYHRIHLDRRVGDVFDPVAVRRFFEANCKGLLMSFGADAKRANTIKPEKYPRFIENVSRSLETCRSGGYFESPDIQFYVDSGGFQVAEGRIGRTGKKPLQDMFYTFLVERDDLYQKAFILDLPPGHKCTAFRDFDEVYRDNLESYLRAASLPDKVREKVIYVHHVRTPMLLDTFTRIYRGNGLFEKFRNFATGSIASNSTSDSRCPYLTYALPLVQFLNDAIRTERKEFGYHVLGGAALRDVFSYEFVRHHILAKHGINVNITFDSINSLNPISGKPFPILGGENVIYKGQRDKANKADGENVGNRIARDLKEFARKSGFGEVEVSFREDGAWDYVTELCMILYVIGSYKEIENRSISKVTELYPLYESGECEAFSLKIEEEMRRLNGGRVTLRHKAKWHALGRTLDLLSSLDEERCRHIVGTYFGRDEFRALAEAGRVLTL